MRRRTKRIWRRPTSIRASPAPATSPQFPSVVGQTRCSSRARRVANASAACNSHRHSSVCPAACAPAAAARGSCAPALAGSACASVQVGHSTYEMLVPAPPCPLNEEYKCGCDRRCPVVFPPQTAAASANPDALMLPCVPSIPCIRRCYCKPGFVRNAQGRCVRPNLCWPRQCCSLHERYCRTAAGQVPDECRLPAVAAMRHGHLLHHDALLPELRARGTSWMKRRRCNEHSLSGCDLWQRIMQNEIRQFVFLC